MQHDALADLPAVAIILDQVGTYYQPQGSLWYFPQFYKLNEHGKYLLIAPSKDRAATLGFRCVVDAQ